MDVSLLPTTLRSSLLPKLNKIKYGHYTKNDFDYPIHLYLKDNDIRIQEDGSDIIKFLREKNVLITGATGFLGKLLLEKLLRCCKDIGKIYVIIRSKKDMDPQSRLEAFLDNMVYYKLSQLQPNYKEKVIGVSGDFALDGLGLSDESRKMLTEEVNIIYHVAATVRFDEPLKKATKINIEGTQEIIKLAKKCKKLDVFVHISTAFANCHEKVIKEEYYKPHMDPYKLILITKELPDDILQKITPAMLQSIPNTYAYTKQIAEDLVKKEAIGLPACIQRPSIVIACAKEPIRSWIDNIFGPVGLIVGATLGLVHIMPAKPNGICDMIPADFVINFCIAASYKTAKERTLDQVPIYNLVSSKENPLHWKDLYMATAQGKKVGSTILLAKGYCKFTPCYYWYLILSFFLHTIPAIIVDFVLKRLGRKPMLRKAYQKIDKFINCLIHFTCNEWKFVDCNTRKLWDELNDKDKVNFPFDIKSLDWQNYFDTYLAAMREFLLKDSLDTLDEGRTHKIKLDIIHYTVVTLLIVLSVYFLAKTIFFIVPLTIITITIYYFIPN